MKPSDIINWIASDLYFVADEESVYLISDYNLGNESCDWGIIDKFSKSDIKNGIFDVANIPDLYIDEYFEFLRKEDLVQTYDVPQEIVNKLPENDYSCWYDILIDNGCDADNYGALKELCQLFKGNGKLEGEIITNQASKEELEYIKKYNELYD